MPISMYEASIPVLKKMLGNLAAILGKAADHAACQRIEPGVFVNARLFPDMFPLSRQVQIATDQAKSCAARLAGIPIPKYVDNEVTFDELLARIDLTVDFLDSIDPALLAGSEEREIVLHLHEKKLEFIGKNYLLDWVLPNFYFHLTTAYAILRHNGIVVGKKDFLGEGG